MTDFDEFLGKRFQDTFKKMFTLFILLLLFNHDRQYSTSIGLEAILKVFVNSDNRIVKAVEIYN